MRFLIPILIGFFCMITNANAAELQEVPMLYVPTLQKDIVFSNGFTPHRGFAGTGYRIEPLHRNHSPMDYKAWHDQSWNDLKVLYGAAWGWPREMSEAQNASDLEIKHYGAFLRQEFFSYTIMTMDGKNVIGSIYIINEKCGNYGGSAYYWIATPYRQEFETTFYNETNVWLNKAWPWGAIYYPGPSLSDKERGNRYVMMGRGLCL